MNIKFTGNASKAEQQLYADYIENKYNRKLEALDIRLDGEYVDLDYKFADVPFDRIRRITGYLVGTMDNWNDAKSSEESDRVKHNIGQSSMEIL